MPSAGAYASVLPIVLLIVLFYFLLIRPQKKQEKKDKAMRDSLVVGDHICTIGGIVGKVVKIDEDELVLETSGGTRMRFKKWAIRAVTTEQEEQKA
ncbi:preprotein translocase subunit YajC [Butyricicoccus sp. MSJd-7]|uniref:Preprotein translocase subunit YajC n=2 Tax=Butyricicoccus intestinisimiae TaxID=2841509 RepID=A0ABS6EUB2_9FIRM|nr:preprotein translocase subunit YajC [Butyricicoccus intestinisimiae]